jgi:hypothetical protein
MSTAHPLEDHFSEAGEMLEHMASFIWESTGVDNTIFLSPKGYVRHAARIKVAIDPPDTLDVTASTPTTARSLPARCRPPCCGVCTASSTGTASAAKLAWAPSSQSVAGYSGGYPSTGNRLRLF